MRTSASSPRPSSSVPRSGSGKTNADRSATTSSRRPASSRGPARSVSSSIGGRVTKRSLAGFDRNDDARAASGREADALGVRRAGAEREQLDAVLAGLEREARRRAAAQLAIDADVGPPAGRGDVEG